MATKRSAHVDDMQEVCAKMGLCLAMLHEIEDKFAKSILFGLNERDKRKGRPFKEVWASRDEMTFGRLVMIMKEKWNLNPELEEFLETFVKERNVFVHRLTSAKGFSLRSKRDRKRLEKRVDRFMELAFVANRLFTSALYTSIDFTQDWLKKTRGIDAGVRFPAEVQERIADFLELVDPKPVPDRR